ncbi:MAG: 6-phosphogluconolactonase [Nocardioidaceae bacterium]|nr:6-phosphogluconolactonase [Nocardioidaceae bacterium]
MTSPQVLTHHSVELLAPAVAARLITRLVDVQSSGRIPSIVLTGGSVADHVHRAIAASAARDAVDWGRVELWWGDERYVHPDDGDRNDLQARHLLLDSLPVDPDRVHAMPADGGHYDVDAAAEAYAAELAAAASPEDHGDVPTFDLVMLGMGPDGHVASLFPERPALYEEERSVVGVHGSPKPPPLRISMTLPALNRAREVWFLVTGEAKARAVRLALGGAGAMQLPAAGVRGSIRTLWFLDDAAARELPPGLSRLASP